MREAADGAAVSEQKCPICDRPGDYTWQGDRADQCEMWTIITAGRCNPNMSAIEDCYKHARPWRKKFEASQLELADVKAKLAAAQGALSRLPEKQVRRMPNGGPSIATEVPDTWATFPDDARIE